MTENPPRPIPRLKHASPGQMVLLAGDKQMRKLLATDDYHGYFDDVKASLCHPVHPAFMTFGDGSGWRVREK
tara:strand:+ start:2759 stop:2974 length:216 start_codon:yes stop_codon:yes gene_type:complete